MAIETQVIPVVVGASEVINKTTFLAVFGSNLCTTTLSTLKRKSRWGKRSVILASFLIMFPANWNITYIQYFLVFFSCWWGFACRTRSHSHVWIRYNEDEQWCRTFLSKNSTEDSRLKSWLYKGRCIERKDYIYCDRENYICQKVDKMASIGSAE